MPCPLCESTDYNILFNDKNRRKDTNCFGTYVQCKECSLVYLQERPQRETIIKFYSSHLDGQIVNAALSDHQELWRPGKMQIPRWKNLLRKVRFRPHSWPTESVPQGSNRLLDVGCGTGVKLIEFAQRGYEVWGADVGNDSIRLCSEMLPQGHFIQGELQDCNFPNDYFDYIRIDNTLEHVFNPREVIMQCRRLLCHGGKIFIYVPHGRSLSMRIMKGDSISSWIPFHQQLFTRRSLYRLMTEAGFRNIRIFGYYPASWLPASITQWEKGRFNTRGNDYRMWLNLVCYPIGWMASKVGLAEELIGTGSR